MRRTRSLLIFVALGLSACSRSGDAPTAVSSNPPDPAEQASATVVADDSPPPTLAMDGTDQNSTPLLDGSPEASGAAATFSPDHLMVGAGARFTVLDDPPFVAAAEATWLRPEDVVLGVVRNGEAVAFPVMQMAYHHIANVHISGRPYLVTY